MTGDVRPVVSLRAICPSCGGSGRVPNPFFEECADPRSGYEGPCSSCGNIQCRVHGEFITCEACQGFGTLDLSGFSFPLYWRNEQSGRMAAIVKKFLQREALSPEELHIFKWYIIQWIDHMLYKPADYRDLIPKMSQEQLYQYLEFLQDKYAIDPF